MNLYIATPHTYKFIFDDMEIYLAGGASGNNNYIWKEWAYKDHTRPMKIFLAGTNSRSYVHKDSDPDPDQYKPYILESYYYISDWMIPYIRNSWRFLLDSGAFTFMQNSNREKVDWNEYLEGYARFIIENDVDLFFELDIDSVVGIKKVEQLRDKLESMTGKRCIPVWHKSRGKQYWLDMIKEWNYVAIGGIVSGEIKRKEYPVFNWFLKTARDQGTKVHGLGFTPLNGDLKKYPFHSVDSTAWIYGNRGGYLYRFTGDGITKIPAPKGMKLKSRDAAKHNFTEWIKFQRYAERKL